MQFMENILKKSVTTKYKAFNYSQFCLCGFIAHSLPFVLFSSCGLSMANAAERVSDNGKPCIITFDGGVTRNVFVAINDKLRQKLRLTVGKQSDPSAAIIDSQSVKTDEQARAKGSDAGKKIKGRKRHILVDMLGLLLKAKVLTADVQDRDGAKLLFTEIKEQMPRLRLIWADGGNRRQTDHLGRRPMFMGA